MCKTASASCRLCLAINISEPFIDLRVRQDRAESIYHLLSLQFSLHNLQSHPYHVCQTCEITMAAFQRLRDQALRNEALLNDNIKTDVASSIKQDCSDEDNIEQEHDEYNNEIEHEEYTNIEEERDLQESLHENENEGDTTAETSTNESSMWESTFEDSIHLHDEVKDEIVVDESKTWNASPGNKRGKPKRVRSCSNMKKLSKEKRRDMRKRVNLITERALMRDGLDVNMKSEVQEARIACVMCGKCAVGKTNFVRHIYTHHSQEEVEAETPEIEFKPKVEKTGTRGRTKENVTRTREMMEKACAVVGVDVNDEEAVKNADFLCPICNKGPFKRASFLHHIKRVHKEPDFPCQFEGCSHVAKARGDINRHMRTVHSTEKTLCTICGESFRYIDSHIQSAHSNVVFKCDFCDKQYTSMTGLKLHVKYHHSGHAKEVCQYCAKEVRDIKQHIRFSHGGVEKQIQCEEPGCSAMFKTAHSAKKHHECVHLNKKQVCQECGGSFKYLNAHIREVHMNRPKKRYVCPVCGNVVAKIQEHMKKTHNINNFVLTKNVQVLLKDLNQTI